MKGNEAERESIPLAIADRWMPGGVVGTTGMVRRTRIVAERADGARVWDVNGKEYLDFSTGAGALILGHSNAGVREAMLAQMQKAWHLYGVMHEPAAELVRLIGEAVPCAERVLMCAGGSEATQYAVRLARAATGRDLIVKFEGGYHGNHDHALINTFYPTGAGGATDTTSDTDGVLDDVRKGVLVTPYNDAVALENLFRDCGQRIAAVIVEPVQRALFPVQDFLQTARALCTSNGALLVFDELVTGFRLAYGGAEAYFGVRPDLAAFGKAIGGGLPLGAVAGRADLLDLFAADRKGTHPFVYANATFQATPLACVAGIATLRQLSEAVYNQLTSIGDSWRSMLTDLIHETGLPARVIGGASLWQIVFCPTTPYSARDLWAGDLSAQLRLDREMIARGILVQAGSRKFVSAAHTLDDLEQARPRVLAAMRACLV